MINKNLNFYLSQVDIEIMTVETDLVGKSISGGSQSQVRGGGLRNTVLSVCTVRSGVNSC